MTKNTNMIINLIGITIYALGGCLVLSYVNIQRLELLIVGVISMITGITLSGLQKLK